ncbi:MAG: hypothetical protein M2R46_05565 [Verrucomicrobia subdivision 3 bacterium]|nr:hypothetical protein [Limisphaerales bacterium]
MRPIEDTIWLKVAEREECNPIQGMISADIIKMVGDSSVEVGARKRLRSHVCRPR